MPFTPVESSVGGLLIGASVANHLLLVGEIAGMSGIFNDVADVLLSQFRKQPRAINNRVLFFVGLVLGGFLLRFWIAPDAFQQFSNAMFASHLSLFNHPLLLSIFAGVFVGFGYVITRIVVVTRNCSTRFGSGCTSGHMIAGVARLSKRSLVSTMTFCTVCLIIVKVFARTQVIHDIFAIAPSDTFVVWPDSNRTVFLLLVLVAVLAMYAVLILVGMQKQQRVYASDSAIPCAVSCFNGLVFALGLGLSGMTLPSKVYIYIHFVCFIFRCWAFLMCLVSILIHP